MFHATIKTQTQTHIGEGSPVMGRNFKKTLPSKIIFFKNFLFFLFLFLVVYIETF